MRKPGPLLTALLLALLVAGPRAALAGNAPSAVVTLDPSFLVGFWGDDGNCQSMIEFSRDGRFIAANGGTGVWSLDGDRVTMTGVTTVIIRIVPIDRDTISVINADGSIGRSNRCAAPRAAAATALVTPAQLLGRWGDNGDCDKLVIFRGDGTFRSHDGGEGSWRLAGERLTMTGANGSTVLILHLIDRNRLRISNPDGSTGVSQRC
jgi:hypothetical protein